MHFVIMDSETLIFQSISINSCSKKYSNISKQIFLANFAISYNSSILGAGLLQTFKILN